jgi:transcription factor MYB, plant
VKNYWNTKLSKKLRQRGIDPITHRPIADLMDSIGALAIRPPQHPNTSAYLPADGLLVQPQPQQQQVLLDADAPASPRLGQQQQQLNWSDFLADDVKAEAQQYHHEVVAPAGGGSAQAGSSAAPGSGGGYNAAGGGDDDAAAFIDAILDCDKETTGVDQLIAELLADPAYYAGSSSSTEMDWGY